MAEHARLRIETGRGEPVSGLEPGDRTGGKKLTLSTRKMTSTLAANARSAA